MKRYAVLLADGEDPQEYLIHAECDTLMEAVIAREERIQYGQTLPPVIVEIIPPVDAYAMAHRETEAAKIKAAYGKPRA